MPEDAVPFSPPAEYRALWDSAQACTGRHGDFDQLHFFMEPGNGFEMNGQTAAGSTRGHDILISEAYLHHPMVIKHEMIHALGIRHHPAHPFVDPCHATWASYSGSSTPEPSISNR